MTLSLAKPTAGTVGWATSINQNFTDIEDAVNQNTPTGAIVMFAAATAPTGWLLCNGAAVSRSTYASLFALIGTTFGAGDGSTTFNVPDMRSRSPLGLGQGGGLSNRTLAQTTGVESHVLDTSEIPAHAHTALGNNGVSGLSGADTDCGGTWLTTESSGGICFNGYPDTSSVGGGGAHNTMHPCLVVNFLIKI